MIKDPYKYPNSLITQFRQKWSYVVSTMTDSYVVIYICKLYVLSERVRKEVTGTLHYNFIVTLHFIVLFLPTNSILHTFLIFLLFNGKYSIFLITVMN